MPVVNHHSLKNSNYLMKKTVKELRDLIADLKDQRKAIHDKSVEEKRSLTDDEKAKWGELGNQIRSHEGELTIEEEAERENAEIARRSNPIGGPGKLDNEQKRQQQFESYSMLKAVRSQIVKGPQAQLDGFELEMHQEAEKEARAAGFEITGIGIPSMVSKAGRSSERRDNSVQMPTQPEDGSILVQTEKRISLDDMLRNNLMTATLGCTYYDDLVGNVDFVRQTERPKATWKPEVANLDKSNNKFGKGASLSPKRLGTYTVESKQFLLQTSPAVETSLREKLAYSLAEGIDTAVIYGDGTDNEPKGLTHADYANLITTISLGQNGGALSRKNLTAAMIKLLSLNINGRNLGWLMNAVTAGSMMDTPIATNSDKFVMEDMERLRGYKVAISNAVLATNNKGTTTNNTLSDMFFGAWENVMVARWGGYDLTVDNITLAKAGQIQLIIQAFADVAIYEPKAFIAFRDVNTN